MKFVVESEAELIEKVWSAIKQKIEPNFFIGLEGDLGAGKTTLVKGLIEKLGSKEKVSSPTFILKKTYPIDHKSIKKINHLDLYRFGEKAIKREELSGLLEDEDSLHLVEWSNYAQEKQIFDLIIKISHLSNSSRSIEIKWK